MHNQSDQQAVEDYRIYLVMQRIAELEQILLNSSLTGGSQEAINSYALQQMEYKGALLEAKFILQLLTNPVPPQTTST